MRFILTSLFCSAMLGTASAQLSPISCIPVYPNNCSSASGSLHITKVTTTGGAPNIGNNSTCGSSSSSYSSFSGPGNTVQVAAGATFKVNVTTTNPNSWIQRVTVWIDWGQDGNYDNTGFWNATTNPLGEMVATGVSSPTVSLTIQVPNMAKNGLTRMRIRSMAGATTAAADVPKAILFSAGGPMHSCNTVNPVVSGETEDYDIYVDNPCVKVPVVNITNVDYKSADVSWVPKGNEQLFEYVVDQNPGNPGTGNTLLANNITSVHLPDAVIGHLECNTQYYFHIRGVCDASASSQSLWYYGPWRTEPFMTVPCCDKPPVVIGSIGSSTANASWSPVMSVQNYEYAISMDKTPPTGGTRINNTNVVLPGLQCSKEYYFFIRALCSPTPQSDWQIDSFLTQPCLGIDNSATGPQFHISMYPNPVKDRITLAVLHGAKLSNGHVIVTDVTGKQLMAADMPGDELMLDMAAQISGIYIIRYADEQHIETLRVNKL